MARRIDHGKWGNHLQCPVCPPRERTWFGVSTSVEPRLAMPREGRTDIVRCPECGYEAPRFSEGLDLPRPDRRRGGGPKPKRPWRGDGVPLGSWSVGGAAKERAAQVATKDEQVREAGER